MGLLPQLRASLKSTVDGAINVEPKGSFKSHPRRSAKELVTGRGSEGSRYPGASEAAIKELQPTAGRGEAALKTAPSGEG